MSYLIIKNNKLKGFTFDKETAREYAEKVKGSVWRKQKHLDFERTEDKE